MFTLRVDLDYVPWDTPDAQEFGHGEPAALLRLLELAKVKGLRLHCFVSNRVLRAFPATAESVLSDGHDLDWFCKHPEQARERFDEARCLFDAVRHEALGMCVRTPWPHELHLPETLGQLRFLTSPGDFAPPPLIHFPVEGRTDRDAFRAGQTVRNWADHAKAALRDAAARHRSITVIVRPQVLSKFDPKLSHLAEIVDLAAAIELPNRTLRQRLA
jgi:hypothetical protein